MSWFDSLFARPAQQVAAAAAIVAPFHQRVLTELDTLARAARTASGTVSPAVFSMLRQMDDILRPTVIYLADHRPVVDTEVALEALITDYIPTPLSLFMTLAPADQADGARADTVLRSQYTTLISQCSEIAAHVLGDTLSALEANALFIQSKFGS